MARATTRQKTSRQASRNKAKKKRMAQLGRWAIVIGGLIGVTAIAGGGWQLYRMEAMTKLADYLSKTSQQLIADTGPKLEHIEVAGRNKTDPDAVMAAVGMHSGSSLFSRSLSDIRASLEALSTVRHANVTRELPDTLLVELEERVPVAVWQQQGKLHVVDAEGRVMEEESPADYPELLLVVGEDAPDHLAELFALLAEEPELQQEVASAVRIGGRRWDVRLRHAVNVMLPEKEPAAAWRKLAEWQREQRILDKAVLSIDLRLKERVFLRMEPTPAEEDGRPSQEI